MQHPRIVLAGIGVVLAAAVGGGVAAAAGGGSGSSNASTSSGAATRTTPAGAVRTMQATVGGKSETILADASGMPLYYFPSDTVTSSAVRGGLAAAWPAVPGSSGTTSLAGGQVSSIQDSHGTQATYNGHRLYTFVSDHPGVVTGQGVENFFVATPGLALVSGAPTPAPAPSNAPAYSGGYGY